MKVLFVCKHNRFRSKVAEAIFKELGRNNEVKSAGVQLDFLKQYVCENVKKVLEEKGYEIKDEQAREINEHDLKWTDLIVIVADNIASGLFKKKTKAKIEIWKISDADEREFEKIRKIVEDIWGRVKNLIKDNIDNPT